MADFGVDRYGKPQGYDQQAAGAMRKKPQPYDNAPQPQQPQDVANGASAQQPKPLTDFATQMQQPAAQGAPAGQPPSMWDQMHSGDHGLMGGLSSAMGGAAVGAPAGGAPQPPQQQHSVFNGAAQAIGNIAQNYGSNTGFNGGNQNQPQGQPQGQPMPQAQAAPQQHYNTQLMEGDPGKLADPNHAANSPKYDFLQLAQKGNFDYSQLPQMLDQLQHGDNARLWQGWTANKDKLTFNGDPSQLAPEWNGVHNVDAIGSFGNIANGGQAAGFRWGAEDPNAPQGGPQGPMSAVQFAAGPQAGPVPGGSYSPPGQAPVPQTGPAPLSGGFQGDWTQGYRPPDSAIYKPGQLPGQELPTYEGAQIGQFSQPTDYGIEGQQANLVKQLMGSTSMSDQNVQQLKQGQMENAMAMQKQLLGQQEQRNAGRGISNMDAFSRRTGDQTLATVLGGNRDVDIAKMQQDRADQMGALGAANDFSNGQMNRATAGFGAQLAGQQAQADQGFKGYQSKADAVNFALQRAMSQEGLNQAGADSMFNNWNGSTGAGFQNRGLDLDATRIGNQNAQFNLSNDLAKQQFADAQKQWRAQLGFNYANAANNSNSTFWQ